MRAQVEILAYSAEYDAYEILHDDGIKLWFDEELVHEHIMEEWRRYERKRKLVSKETARLQQTKLETVSEETERIKWGDSKPHNLAMLKDGYVAKKRGYDEYPARAKKNGFNVPLMATHGGPRPRRPRHDADAHVETVPDKTPEPSAEVAAAIAAAIGPSRRRSTRCRSTSARRTRR